MGKQEFIHGIDTSRAIEYLKDIGVYDDVIKTSTFGGLNFEIIIAANIEYKKRNG